MDVRLIKDRSSWNRFVTSNHHSKVFHLWEWGDLCEYYGHSKHYIAAVDDGEIMGILPLIYVKSHFFGKQLVSMPFCEYGFPLAGEDVNSSTVIRVLLEEAKRIAGEIQADFVELRGLGQGIEEALSMGFRKYERFLTFELNLEEGEEKIWSRFEKCKRNGVRKAIKMGVTWEEIENKDGLESYYTLFLKTMREHGTPPHSFKFFERMYDVLAPRGWMKIYVAYINRIPINGIIFFPFNKNILYWSAVSDIDHRNLCGGDLLLWEAIKWGMKNGFEVFDLGRTRKESGVYLYKKGYNAAEKKLRDLFLFRGKKDLVHPDKLRYRVFEKIWEMLPSPIANSLGPKIRSEITL